MNILVITGNVIKDGILRQTPNGKAVLGFDIANNQGFGDNQHTEYYKCSVWGDRAEKLAQHITKGKKLTITGEHRTDKREHDGKTYFDNKVFVKELDFGGESSGASNKPSGQSSSSAAQAAPASDFDEDPPF